MKDISIDNLNLIYWLRQYMAKHIIEFSEEETNNFEDILRRLQNAEY